MSSGERYTGPCQAWALGAILNASGRVCRAAGAPRTALMCILRNPSTGSLEAGLERLGGEGPCLRLPLLWLLSLNHAPTLAE